MYPDLPNLSRVSVTCCRVGIRSSPRVERFGEAEVEHLHRSVVANLDVRRLQIPMDDSMLMGLLQRLGELPGNRKHVLQRQGAERQPRPEILAFDQLHGDSLDAVCLFEAVYVSDRWMIERGECLRFALKTFQSFGVGSDNLRQDLQRHLTMELRVGTPGRPLPCLPHRSVP